MPPSIGAAAGETAGEDEDAACAAAGGFDEAAGASVRGAAEFGAASYPCAAGGEVALGGEVCDCAGVIAMGVLGP